jgi:hypothetical protein
MELLAGRDPEEARKLLGPCEDDAVCPCYAVLRMQETVTRYVDSVRRAEGLPL